DWSSDVCSSDLLQFTRGADAYAVEESIRLQKKSIEVKLEDVRIDQEMLKMFQLRLDALKKQNEEQKDEVTTLKTLKDEVQELNRIRQEDTPAANQAEIDSLARLIAKKEDEILKIEDNIAWQKKWNDQTIITRLAQENLTRSLDAQKKAISDITEGLNPDYDALKKELTQLRIVELTIPDDQEIKDQIKA